MLSTKKEKNSDFAVGLLNQSHTSVRHLEGQKYTRSHKNIPAHRNNCAESPIRSCLFPNACLFLVSYVHMCVCGCACVRVAFAPRSGFYSSVRLPNIVGDRLVILMRLQKAGGV